MVPVGVQVRVGNIAVAVANRSVPTRVSVVFDAFIYRISVEKLKDSTVRNAAADP